MSLTRRDFLCTSAAAAAAPKLGATRIPQAYFGLHPFIEANPKAVFIRRTHVPHKMDEAAKRREGLTLSREIFVPAERPGVPVSHRIILKPNVCSVRSLIASGVRSVVVSERTAKLYILSPPGRAPNPSVVRALGR